VNRWILALGVAWLSGSGMARGDSPRFELADGDRVVLIGGTLVERDQAHGFLEARLTRLWPRRSVTFRNLGWSGDTVEGPSRAGFGTTADGFKHLKEHVLALRPTVVIVGYGGVEAFDGPAALPGFRQKLEVLLTTVAPAGARLVFLSPNRQENLGSPLPDPARHNADLAAYRDVLKSVAETRKAAFVDLFELLPDGAQAQPRRPLTDNGLHFTAYGSSRMAEAVEQALGVAPEPWSLQLDGTTVMASGTKLQAAAEKTSGGIKLRLVDTVLPAPRAVRENPSDRVARVKGLAPGRYRLAIDGMTVATADAAGWERGQPIDRGPERDQVEALRRVINAKNELYFYRWRPQNETYLFGFRKHEQGQNAREIPEFDPLVADREAEIARLRVPLEHTYEWIREGEVKP
jgi:lysophospholipase L1-like esterase